MCRLVGTGCSEPSSNPSSELEHCGLTAQSSHLKHGDKVMHISTQLFTAHSKYSGNVNNRH